MQQSEPYPQTLWRLVLITRCVNLPHAQCSDSRVTKGGRKEGADGGIEGEKEGLGLHVFAALYSTAKEAQLASRKKNQKNQRVFDRHAADGHSSKAGTRPAVLA